jgi:hypothetical protein
LIFPPWIGGKLRKHKAVLQPAELPEACDLETQQLANEENAGWNQSHDENDLDVEIGRMTMKMSDPISRERQPS